MNVFLRVDRCRWFDANSAEIARITHGSQNSGDQGFCHETAPLMEPWRLLMNVKSTAAFAVILGSTVAGGVANAQGKDQAQSSGGEGRVAPVTNAVELSVGTGYTQGFGKFDASLPSLPDDAQAGGGVQLGVGYRITPQLTLGAYGSFGAFGRGDSVDSSTNIYTATAGFEATWHVLPSSSLVDPWVSLGSGWRGYWMTANSGTTSIQGMEIARLQIGADFRLDKAVAVGPVFGADVNTFFTQSTPEVNTFTNLPDPHASTFLFAGIQGRFDIPTGSQSAARIAAR
jgi:hypothetical protein